MGMKIGAFQVKEPLPELNEPTVLLVLDPWIDVGDVGTTTLGLLEKYLGAERLGELPRPGDFFDFTRYRPVIRLVDGEREVEIPNSYINYAHHSSGEDFLFMHMREPHMQGEVYADSIFKVMKKFGAKRYCLVGSMYDAVPHTRPLIVSGGISGQWGDELRQQGVISSDYEGPTAITVLVSQAAAKHKMEIATLVVHLPQYVSVDKDYIGVLRLMEIFCSLYNFPFDLRDLRVRADEQNRELGLAIESEPQLKEIVKQLEIYYESRVGKPETEQPELSPEIEKFLRDATKHFDQG